MTVYPFALDSDSEIIRVDDNLTEIGGLAINQLRDAMFAIQAELGINPAGSAGSVANRLDVSFNADGTIKASALTSVGLASLPIVDSQVADNAGIKEIKLTLDHSTADLYTLIVANTGVLNSLSAFTTAINTDLLIHIQGGLKLSDGSTLARHVASHIDLNSVTSDSRDSSYTWTGLLNKNGTLRSATHVADALLQINNELVDHENATSDAHVASAISVDTSAFVELTSNANTVQKALEEVDNAQTLLIGDHRATQHSNGIPKNARSLSLINPDGYNQTIVPVTPAEAFLVRSPAVTPQDSNTAGDDLIIFNPSNTNYTFDAQFSQVKFGDVIRINYGNGIEAIYTVESTRHIPGSEWVVRINGVNLADTDGYDGYARIDRTLFDTNTYGVLALASANNDIDNSIMPSLIAGHPHGATTLGLGFDSLKLDSTHYKLYLQLYPTGNPTDRVIDLPYIDVTGNAGVTPGQYTLDTIVAATNDAFRAAGYNFRFIAFAHKGEFGIMLADPIGNASFSIVSGTLSGASLVVGTYTENVIGDANDGKDGLGLGGGAANLASPAYVGSFGSAEAALTPTKIIMPLKRRNYIVNGVRRDTFATTPFTTDNYWLGEIINRQLVGTTTVETTYKVNDDLCIAELKPGKTIVVQPTVAFNSASYLDSDYGRFIIKEVLFAPACGDVNAYTTIKVVNGIHATGNPISTSSGAGLQVKLYFSEDSISFNAVNIVDSAAGVTTYNRFHEIYVTEEGKTFSHERARLVRQSETSNLLATTDRWNIRYVSSKLRGFTDTGSANLNKYIRFYVLNYNVTTGEYDGYIGKRVVGSPQISNIGIITRARKNIPARFYDETNIDYIELEFFDETSSPGTDVMSSNAARYVDIELFDSLINNDTAMLIGTCELEQNRVHAVRDARQFGNVSEVNFTNSAIDYIESGDRHLHANGAINGLEFISASSNVFTFSGGLALVDGKVVAVNNGTVTIPEIRDSGSGLPQTLNWAICVNKYGHFESILLNANQIYATTGSGANYLIPSTSFTNLVNLRKDLTVIYIANITIASFTLNSMTDAKRYVLSETLTSPLTLIPNSRAGEIGHFKSFDAVKNWINNYGSLNNTVKVRGSINITSTIDLSGLSNAVTFDGENASFNVSVDKGFVVGSNVTFKNLTFNYTPTVQSPASDLILRDKGGCIFGPKDSSVSEVKDVVIENCSFNCSIAGYRPPFINFDVIKNQILDGIIVKNCKFTDTSTSNVCAAIAVINENTGASSNAPIIANSLFENNVCNAEQGIYIATKSVGTVIQGPGLNCVNTSIKNNILGSIGYTISSYYLRADARGIPGTDLTIKGNKVRLIYHCNHAGMSYNNTTTDGIDVGTGNIVIKNNNANWIITNVSNSDVSSSGFGSLIIDGNNLNSYTDTYLTSRNFGASNSIAISISAALRSESSEKGSRPCVKITNNNIDAGREGSTDYSYIYGIYTNASSLISNNDIYGFTTYGIVILSPYGSIQGNRLRRGTTSITAYILITTPTSASESIGICTDNIFDSPTINGSSTSVISVSGSTVRWVIEKNKNQTVTYTIESFRGTAAFSNVIAGTSPAAPNSYIQGYDMPIGGTTWLVEATVGAADGYVAFQWTVPLHGVLPENVTVLSISTSYRASASILPGATNGEGVLALRQGVTTESEDMTIVNGSYTGGTTVPVTLTPTSNTFKTNRSGNEELIVYTTMILDHSSTLSYMVYPLQITYRW